MKRLFGPILLLALALLGLTRLRFDAEVLNLLPANLPAAHGLRLQQKHFSTAKELILTLESADADAAESAARLLAQHLRDATNLVASAVWQPPWLDQPVQAAELAAFLWLNQPPAGLAELASRLARPAETLTITRERLATSFSPVEIARLSRDPFGLTDLPAQGAGMGNLSQEQSFFSSPDGTFRLVLVKPRQALADYRADTAWLADIRNLVKDWQGATGEAAGINVQFTGGPAFTSEIANGMERDMKPSLAGTVALVALIFWVAYRRLKPLLWLLCLLALTVLVTLGLAGWCFGQLNVISLGFAAVLLGLCVDYGVLLYEDALQSPGADARTIRRHATRGIIAAAFTTAAAFATLAFSGLNGLVQLGLLVAAGLMSGSFIMLWAYLPPLLRSRPSASPSPHKDGSSVSHPAPPPVFDWPGWILTAALAFALVTLLVTGMPTVEHSSAPLRPQRSEAYDAAQRIATKLQRSDEPVWLFATGKDETVMAGKLDQARIELEALVAKGVIRSFTLPNALWPRPDRQAANRATLAGLAGQREQLTQAALTAGFTAEALKLTHTMLDFWAAAANRGGVIWPDNEASRWMMERFAARTPEGFAVMGLVELISENTPPELLAAASRADCQIAGWNLLGEELLARVTSRVWLVLGPMCVVLLICLWLTFRRWRETLLCLVLPMAGGVVLLAVMKLAGWPWNLMNLTAVPLLLGSGVDYGIHLQLALRRHGGNARTVRRTTGRALLVFTATTVVGFGSLAWSGNAGLASLGKVCAVGIGATCLISLAVLPLWWRLLCPPTDTSASTLASPSQSTLSKPSVLYRGVMWNLGLLAARWLPRSVLEALGGVAGGIYWHSRKERREVVIANLLPVFAGDRAKATKTARRLVVNFTRKLIDLWRFEAGAPVLKDFDTWEGWEIFQQAHARGKGVLMLTPHLGNWELGALLLIERGAHVLVLSHPEPDDRLTAIRQQARARWGIDTLIVGRDPFAFVEVIKRLQDGATVALLMDRPAESTAVEVEFFERSFHASIAAAELARASGCAVIPSYIIRRGAHYESHILPELAYDRLGLGDREARRQFTAEIMRAFEPVIRQHPDQWYHFVPIWPADGRPR